MKTFRSTRSRIAPRWLTTGEGGLVGYALDLIKDAFADRAFRALMARFPQNDPTGTTTAPTDALTALGRDRRVVRGLFETDVQYAARLVRWLDDRRSAGTAFALMRVLHAYVGSAHGVSFRVVDNAGNWFSRAADGNETSLLATGNWNWDGATTGNPWARFWVVIYPGTLWPQDAAAEWGSGTWGSAPRLWGSSTITAEQITTLRALIADWKPQGTRCQNIILAFDPASFSPAAPEPDGTWGKPYKIVGDVAVPSRLTTAAYLDGV